jgi:hypothetical protein
VTATLLSTLATLVAALFLGQAALRLAGAHAWSWLAPPVGMSIAMLASVPAIHVPGRCATSSAVLALLTVAAVVWCLRSPVHRPPLVGLAMATPVALMTLIPFIAVGRAGILGTSLSNDMGAHMSLVEAYLSQHVADVTPLLPDYPLGPHAMVALLAKGLGIRVDQAFAGWTIALPILTAWTALALVRRASRLGQLASATVVGMPFLVAAYYGEASFKEVLLADLVLAVALLLSGCDRITGRGRWIPLALLTGGIVSVYSLTGLPWPATFLALWIAGTGVLHLVRHGLRGTVAEARRRLPEAGLAAVVVIVVLLPQLPRIERFVSLRRGVNGTGIRKDDIGNLIGSLPGWEALGVWNNPDFRMPASPAFTAGMSTAFVLALVLLGVARAVRSGRWLLPLAAGSSMLIWAVSAHSQSPYVAAKALVIASPLVVALAILPLVERGPRRPPWWTIAPPLTLLLVLQVGISAVRALRISPVGPTDHARELRALRPLLHGQPTLFLANDDYIRWELAGVPVGTPVINDGAQLPIRPQKAWSYGRALDFDSVDTATLNVFDWIITTRDAAGSAPPPNVRLVRETDSYALWRRVGAVEPHAVLSEGDQAGVILDCDTPEARALVRAGGVAAVRKPAATTPVIGVSPGGTAAVRLDLRPGRWDLQMGYASPLRLTVTAPRLRTTLPANLERPGPRWRIGRIAIDRPGPITLMFRSESTPLTPSSAVAAVGPVIATPVGSERTVPLRRACGRYVDWYHLDAREAATRTGSG